MTSIRNLTFILLYFIVLNQISPVEIFAQTSEAGSFENSCIDCSYDNETTALTCKCEKLDGSYNTTSLYNIQPGGLDIQNINGDLQEVLPLPSGSYTTVVLTAPMCGMEKKLYCNVPVQKSMVVPKHQH